jgi:hypothetical protein
MRKISKRAAVIAVSAVAAVGLAGTAFAFWTTPGAGDGSGTTGSVTAIKVNQTSTVAGLYPGGGAVPLAGNFDNSNDHPVHINNVTATVLSTNNGGCTAENFQITGIIPAAQNVPVGNGTGSWSGGSIALLDTGVNQDVCKDVTVSIKYSVN